MKNVSQLRRIESTGQFKRQRNTAPLDIKIALREALEIFSEDPDNKTLRNHSLNKQGKRYHGLWSIDVTDDWRAIYRKERDQIIFMMLKTHEMLYGD